MLRGRTDDENDGGEPIRSPFEMGYQVGRKRGAISHSTFEPEANGRVPPVGRAGAHHWLPHHAALCCDGQTNLARHRRQGGRANQPGWRVDGYRSR